MIWARPLGSDGAWLTHPMLGRSRLSPSERALVLSGLEQVALVTGLDADARELLASVVGTCWLGGAHDTAVVRVSRTAFELWEGPLLQLPELERALRRFVQAGDPLPALTVGPKTFQWGARTYVMGVLNVTPDSFSGDGRVTVAAALERARALVAAGVDLLDVGGESTRPGAEGVDEATELARVVPVIEALAQQLPEVPLSIDTTKPAVARQAVRAGAHFINDISALADDELLRAVVELGVPAGLMHLKGTPRTMQDAPRYDDVMSEVLDTLELALERAEGAGVPRSRLVVDPGIGFGKTLDHNLFLLRHANHLRLLGCPVLVGASRKRFLGALSGVADPADRLLPSVAAAAVVAVQAGADLVRVHDVAQTRQVLAVADAVARATAGGAQFSA